MGRTLGVACKSGEILFAIAEDGRLIEDAPHEKLIASALLDETERLEGTLADITRVLHEVRPDVVRVMLPEQTYEDSYARIAPRVALETLVRLACVNAGITVETLPRITARSRLGIPSSGRLENHLRTGIRPSDEPVGRYWNSGRSLAAAAALADED
jgi:hypothetical protein